MLYAVGSRPTPAVVAMSNPALALDRFVTLARPGGTLVVAQLLVLCAATATAAGLAALASGTADGLWIGRMLVVTSVALTPITAGCPAAPGGSQSARRIWLPGLALAAATRAAAFWAPSAPGPRSSTRRCLAGPKATLRPPNSKPGKTSLYSGETVVTGAESCTLDRPISTPAPNVARSMTHAVPIAQRRNRIASAG